ncbi:hypothetical protein F5883DRAFT_662052 [Diaporthe sp. PMI_573]|nr:hypothetical protein F5883DRAFT_662052 [Diaporthaceae sp. PMI_573]
MASNYTHRITNSASNIAMFGNYYRAILSAETDVRRDLPDGSRLLRPDEISFMRGHATYDNSALAAACQERLNLGTEYYYAVKHQITSMSRLWDAVIDEKRRYDTVGWHVESRDFMDGFLLCSHMIPQRVNIGFLGPFVGVPGLDACCENIPVTRSCAAVSYRPRSPSAVNGNGDAGLINDLTNYEDVVQGCSPGPLRLREADWEDGPEALALSPNFSDDSTLIDDAQGGEIEVISISSDESDGNDGEYSDYSDELQFQLELDAQRALPREGAEDTDSDSESQGEDVPNDDHIDASWPSELFPDGTQLDQSAKDAWERFLNDNDPEKQQPSREEAKLDESLAGHQLGNLQPSGQPLGPQFERVTSKKRKFAEIHDRDNEHDYEEAPGGGKSNSGKRPSLLCSLGRNSMVWGQGGKRG